MRRAAVTNSALSRARVPSDTTKVSGSQIDERLSRGVEQARRHCQATPRTKSNASRYSIPVMEDLVAEMLLREDSGCHRSLFTNRLSPIGDGGLTDHESTVNLAA